MDMSCAAKETERFQGSYDKNKYEDVIAQSCASQLWWEEYSHFHYDVMIPYTWNLVQLKPEYAEISGLLLHVLELHMEIMSIAASQKGKPEDVDYLFNALLESINDVKNCRLSYSSSSSFNLLKAIKVGVTFFGWVIRKWNPVKFIEEIEADASHYTNLIPIHPGILTFLNMAKSWISIIKMCREYVNDHHETGLSWKPKTIKPQNKLKNKSSSLNEQEYLKGITCIQRPDFSEVFQQIRNFLPRSDLKKVDSDLKSYRNQISRATNFLQMGLKSKVYDTVLEDGAILELDNRKWIIENQNENQNLILRDTDEKQIVYMYNCKNSLLNVPGKVNSIIIDSCKNCDVVFTDAWSTCNIVNCSNIKAQIDGCVPLISLEKTDGIHIYIKENNLMETEVMSTMTSHAVLSIMREDGNISEFQIKEQFKSVWDGYTLHTDPV